MNIKAVKKFKIFLLEIYSFKEIHKEIRDFLFQNKDQDLAAQFLYTICHI